MTAKKKPAEAPARKKHGPDNLRALLKKLPADARERAAFDEHGAGYTREEFRELWLEHLKAEPWRHVKGKPDEIFMPDANEGEPA